MGAAVLYPYEIGRGRVSEDRKVEEMLSGMVEPKKN
jgi:hypothetical protein